MLPVVFQACLFDKDDANYEHYSRKCLEWMLECLVNINREVLRHFPEIPNLYDASVKYAREDGTEDWESILSVIRHRQGDCEDLACWRVAELRERFKEAARPIVRYRNDDGFWHYHIQVLRGDGKTIEDPSARLGMGTVGEGKQLSNFITLRTKGY